MQLVAACWSNGVKAEFVPRINPSINEQYEFAHSRGIRWIVMLDERQLAKVGMSRASGTGSLHLAFPASTQIAVLLDGALLRV